MVTDDILEKLQIDDEAIVSKMINDLVEEHRGGRGRIAKELEERYRQTGLPIQTRTTRNPNKVDERIPNDFFSDVIDTKQGYMGNEVTVELQDGTEGQIKALHDFAVMNDAVDQNSEMVKAAARDGAGYRLLYIAEGETDVRIKQLPASETVVYRDASLGSVTYAMRYWKIKEKTYQGSKEVVVEKTAVEWYDKENITFYIDDGRGKFQKDTTKGNGGEMPHMFNGVPIVEFKNNEECKGEAEKALDLIDAYDTVLSATASEIEQLRLAYMALKDAGGQVDDTLLQVMEQTGILALGQDGDAKFVTKDIKVDGVKIILDELRKNIYEFSRSIDLSKDYGGDMRVMGWQIAISNLENSCKVTERKFTAALREQWRMICDLWKGKGVQIDYLDLTFTFTRNFPRDVDGEAETLGKLIPFVSRKTAYGLVSFIPDPEIELEAWEEDKTKEDAAYSLFGDEEKIDEPKGGPEEGENVQAQALNGAQIKSLVDIASQVAMKTLPPETAIEILLVAIPSLTPQDAQDIISPAANFEVENAITQPTEQPEGDIQEAPVDGEDA